jgi:hypothetical protein
MNQSGWLTFSKLDFLARARFGKLDYKNSSPAHQQQHRG